MAASSSLPTDISTVVKSGNFAFDGEKFTAYDHPREDQKRLKEILFPEKSWYMSQLQHYGVTFKSKDTVAQLRERLESAVKQGACKKVPDDHQKLEEELRSTYNTRLNTSKASGKKAAKAGPSNIKAAAANPTAKTPASKTAANKSAPKKSASQASSSSKAATKPTTSKQTAIKSTEPKRNQKSKVEKPKPAPKPKAKAPKAPKAAERDEAETSAQYSLDSESSGNYPPQTARKSCNVFQTIDRVSCRKSGAYQTIQQPARGSNTFTPRGNIFLDAVGDYEIESSAITDEWDVDEDDLKLTIMRPGNGAQSHGWFDLGILEGVMKFSTDPEFIRHCDVSIDHEYDEMEWEGGENSSETSNGNSRRRLYFQWRGKDSDQFGGMIHYQNERQGGYLEFDDEVCSGFTGYGSFPALGIDFRFRGYKQYDEPDRGIFRQNLNIAWQQYSEQAHEEANRARWR